jgi:diaminopimelate decarboxylase
LYACKANTNTNILKIMRENGINGIDAVSPNEVLVALKAGFKPQ